MQPTDSLEHNALDEAGDLQREQRLDEILAAYLKAVDSGVAPDRAELLARHPELADGLADFFAEQDELERMAESLINTRQGGSGTPALARQRVQDWLKHLYDAWGRPAEAAKYRSGLSSEQGKEEPGRKD
jgi:hypothetical protein